MHLPECRRGTHLIEVRDQPRSVSDWGALGVFVGRRLTNYWLFSLLSPPRGGNAAGGQTPGGGAWGKGETWAGPTAPSSRRKTRWTWSSPGLPTSRSSR